MKSEFNDKAARLAAEDILSIPEAEPERLFPRDADDRKDFYRALARKWHTDVNKSPKAKDVFTHIGLLHTAAEKKAESGTWHTPGVFEIMQDNGKVATIRYLKKGGFELGEFYICKNKLVFVVRTEFSDLFDNAVKNIRHFEFKNDRMREQFVPQLPQYVGHFVAKDGRKILVVERDPDMILLRDLMDYSKGKLDPSQAAWVMSRLHNMACYLQWAGLTHNGISPDTVFVLPYDNSFARTADKPISPKDHTMCLLGGWWYAAREGKPIKGLAPRTVNYAPKNILKSGIADRALDHIMIRITGREMLGDITGVDLLRDPHIKPQIVNWLTVPGTGDAIKDFEIWQQQVLKAGFGGRRYAEAKINPGDIYQPLTIGA